MREDVGVARGETARRGADALPLLLLAVAVVTACAPRPPTFGEDAAGDGLAADASACAPPREAFEATALPRIERYCGSCHGARPEFGASVSLLSHEALLAPRAGGARLVDLVARRIIDGTMPPVGMPRMPDDDATALVAWATCGQRAAPPAAGLVSSAPPVIAPAAGPPGLESLALRAPDYAVSPTARDAYRCFVFDADLPADRFVRRFEMIYGDTRVLHHVVLSRDRERRTMPGSFDCTDGSGMPVGAQYLYVWAPGQSALEFPEGGLRVSPGERFILQIHYNNGAGLPDVRDASGVRLMLGPATGTEYGMFALGAMDFRLPARQRTSVASRCTIDRDTTLFAGMPHMHRLGAEFETVLAPAGAAPRPLVRLRGWSFDTQLFYHLPVTLRAGDVLRTTCTFDNVRDVDVTFGEGTDDEMCNNFVYATPPPSSPLCSEGNPDRPTDVAYVPGACLPAGTPTNVPLVRGGWTQVAAPPAVAPAPVPDARWVLESAAMFATGGATPIGTLDLAASYLLARGQALTAGGRLTYDVSLDTVVLLSTGARFGMPDRQGFVVPLDPASGRVDTAATCPAAGPRTAFEWGLEGDVLTVTFTRTELPGQTLWPRFRFRRER